MTISIADLIAAISLVISLSVASFNILKIVKENKKTQSESKKLETETEKIKGADTTKVYAEAAKIVGEQNIELRTRIESLEKRIDELCESIKMKDNRILELEQLSQEQEVKIKNQGQRIQELEAEVLLLKNDNHS